MAARLIVLNALHVNLKDARARVGNAHVVSTPHRRRDVSNRVFYAETKLRGGGGALVPAGGLFESHLRDQPAHDFADCNGPHTVILLNGSKRAERKRSAKHSSSAGQSAIAQ